MYDFHKRKSNPNEHIFEHKNFIKTKKELLKLIKRKTKKDNNINEKINQIYTQYIPYISNKFLPGKDTDLVPINQNINNNENNFFSNNNNKSFLSLDENLSLNNKAMKSFYKKMPLLPMGSPVNINNENILNNNYNINNINNNNYNYKINNNINNYYPNKDEKKITKKYLQNHLSYLMDSIEKNTEMQNQLEIKIESLSKQNEEFINQNQNMLQEIMSKNDYNKKLEAVICFILEMIMSKSKMKSNPELNKLLLSNETNLHNNNLNNLGLINFNNPSTGVLSPNVLSSNDFNSDGNLESFKAFINKYWEKSKNNGLLINKDNNQYNKILDEDKYFYTSYNNNYNTNLNAKILKKNLIGEKENNYQISPFIFNNKRKRSSSFNSILSNLSKGSNVIYNNNKLLKNEEEEKERLKIEDKKTDKNDEKLDNNTNDNNIDNNINDNMNFDLSRKDSISNESKNAFDLDLNQEENKSYLSGWSKDLLNNSQSSFNEVYNNVNKDNDSFSNLNN